MIQSRKQDKTITGNPNKYPVFFNEKKVHELQSPPSLSPLSPATKETEDRDTHEREVIIKYW